MMFDSCFTALPGIPDLSRSTGFSSFKAASAAGVLFPIANIR